MVDSGPRHWLRDLNAGSWIDLFLVSAITAILGIRGYLALTNYPRVGGESLHVAHMLWGGLLMGAALVLALGFHGRRVRPVVAVIGGLGFGTFVDEVGKFVTHDNDYFFAPAVAIIYATLVLLYLSARWLVARQPPHPTEQLAHALRELDEALLDDLDADERERILTRLQAADPDGDLHGAIRTYLEKVQLRPTSHPSWELRTKRWLLTRYRGLVASRWFVRGLIAFFLGHFALEIVGATAIIVRTGTQVLGRIDGVTGAGLLASSLISGALVAAGVQALARGRRNDALRHFQKSVIVTLLLGQVFEFHLQQWSALAGLGLQLVLYSALRFAREHDAEAGAEG